MPSSGSTTQRSSPLPVAPPSSPTIASPGRSLGEHGADCGLRRRRRHRRRDRSASSSARTPRALSPKRDRNSEAAASAASCATASSSSSLSSTHDIVSIGCNRTARRRHGGCDDRLAMRTAETVAGLAAFARRGAGTDAERRAASWLAGELRESGREAVIEPFWCRPNWAFAHAWHVFLGARGQSAVGSLAAHRGRVDPARTAVGDRGLDARVLSGATAHTRAGEPERDRGRPARRPTPRRSE